VEPFYSTELIGMYGLGENTLITTVTEYSGKQRRVFQTI